ncbi:MAG: phosphatase PAP2 family protein [Dehalococcoidales bacterium]|nr:MAG: phosphatase PAP2 family protein [Dehalococcoidales bacterium]
MIDSSTFDHEPLSEPSGKRQRIANLTSNIFNPFLLCLALIVLLSFKSAGSTPEAIKWALISTGLGILPVFMVIIYLLRQGKLDDFFIAAREQRTKIYIIGCLSAAAGCITLALLGAPTVLVAGFITGVSTAIVFAIINLWWKISLHTAIVAASATILVMIFGWIAAASVALVPLTAWSRIELECHSLTQTVGGALLATLLVFFLFQPLAMI